MVAMLRLSGNCTGCHRQVSGALSHPDGQRVIPCPCGARTLSECGAGESRSRPRTISTEERKRLKREIDLVVRYRNRNGTKKVPLTNAYLDAIA